VGGPSLAFVAGRLEPASHPSAHRDLDLAVIDAFGWEAAVLGDVRERNRRLYGERQDRRRRCSLQAVVMAAPLGPAARRTLRGP
jgi:hypothetical protein